MTVGGAVIYVRHTCAISIRLYYIKIAIIKQQKSFTVSAEGGNMSDTHASYSSIFFTALITLLKYIIRK